MFDDFLDNLQKSAESAFGDFSQAALQSGLETIGFVKQGEPDKGNLSEKQIAQGMRGSFDTTIQPRVEQPQAKNPFGFPINKEMGIGALIVGGLILLAILLRRR